MLFRVGIDVRDDYYRVSRARAQEIIQAAILADKAGAESFWSNEDVGRDTAMLLGIIAHSTSQIKLGTAIENIYAKTAMQIAMSFATIDEVSQGRAIVGLGSGHMRSIDRGHGVPLAHPIDRMREYVEILNRAFTGERFAHDGKFFKGMDSRLNFFRPRHIPIFVAGHKPRMIQLAGEIADGVMLNVWAPECLRDIAIKNLEIGARRAGRAPEQVDVSCVVSCCVDEDEDVALDLGREILFGGRYTPKKEFWPERYHRELDEIINVFNHDPSQARIMASDNLVRQIVNAGTPQQINKGLETYRAVGVKRVILAPYPYGLESAEKLVKSIDQWVFE